MAYINQCHLPCVLHRFLSPAPTPLGPPHRGRRAATTSRVSMVPTPPRTPMTLRRQLLPGRPGQMQGSCHTAGTLAPRPDARAWPHRIGTLAPARRAATPSASTLAPARRAATPPAALRYTSCSCSDPIPSISMHETLRTYVLGNDHGNRTYMLFTFSFIPTCML